MSVPTRPPLRYRASRAAVVAVALAAVACCAQAAPRWSIAQPVPEGKQSPLSAAPLQKRAAQDKDLAERYPVHVERIEVEGVREREFRAAPPRTTEQRFADTLNEGSPELMAGRSYDGYYYDGTLFWGSDPLSFAWKNITHWLQH
ncbi:MAG TPA: hypothetical protein VF059_11960 [Casimicrobiaceae bacterium]